MGEQTVNDRWWVDPDRKEQGPEGDRAPAGSRFYRAAAGYDQDRALAELTDINRKLIERSGPEEGSWTYVPLAEKRCSKRRLEWVKRQVALPPYARGVLVDSDGRLRILVTGTPPGERILELTLGDDPAFDCWINGEWTSERAFANEQKALSALRGIIRRMLSPEGLAFWREIWAAG